MSSKLTKSNLTLHSFKSEHLLAVANFFADWPGTCLLLSGGVVDSAQVSFLALFPYDTITINNFSLVNPWDELKDFFSSLKDDYAFGFLGYEMGAFSDVDKRLPYYAANTPNAYWQKCAIVAKCDHHTHQTHVIYNEEAFIHLSGDEAQWARRLTNEQEWHTLAQKGIETQNNKTPLQTIEILDRKSSYLEKLKIAQEYIRAGEIYQVNLSQQFTFQGKRHPFDVFYRAHLLNPAPFSAYFNLDQFSIVSTSPERLLKKSGTQLETRPIKGTIKRGKTRSEDEEFKRLLLCSPKERAELLMITDLMRNDLGKISQVGSVITPEIWRCEAYTNVFHLLSVIQSQAKQDLTSLEMIRSCFPGGSVTGCPKLRAMEVIAELEQRPRGIYTGSIGYFKGQEEFDLNIAIRTLLFTKEYIHLQLGGGIVIDSIPELEYEETLIKGNSLFNILA